MNNGQKPATKQDLANLKGELTQDLADLRDELREAIHDSETRLLKAFYNYVDGAQLRFADLDGSDASLRDRLEGSENRIFEVEKRLNRPPAP